MQALDCLIQPMRALYFNLWIDTTISWCIVDEYGYGEFWSFTWQQSTRLDLPRDVPMDIQAYGCLNQPMSSVELDF